jgi:hypothetical protein
MSEIKAIHPEILYAERSSETEAEKVCVVFYEALTKLGAARSRFGGKVGMGAEYAGAGW